MDIGDIAKSTGIRPSCIRYYEKQGLIPPALRKPSGYRDYSSKVIEVLLLIKMARSQGFSLADLKHVLPDAKGWPSQKTLLAGLGKMLRDVERQTAELGTTRKQLKWLIRTIERRPPDADKEALVKVVVSRLKSKGDL